MGIEEDKLKAIQQASSRLMVARADPDKLKQALLQVIGNHGAHIDLRMKPEGKSYWEGGEIMIGNIEGLPKLNKLKQKNQKLRFGWKVGHKVEGQPQAQIVRGSLERLKIGTKKVEISEPGEVGATKNKGAAFIAIDKYKWQLYSSDQHAKKFHFENRILNGNFLFAFVPVQEGGRVWMVSRLSDDDHLKPQPTKKLQEAKKSKYSFKILKLDRKKQIAGGIVYEPHVEDTQGDFTDPLEIEKAMYRFMERYSRDPRKIKIEHQGKTHYFPVLECFQPEEPTKKGDTKIPAGAWWLMIKITDKRIWDLVEKGEITGFSMGGTAKGEKKDLTT